MKEKIKDWFEWHEEEIKLALVLIIGFVVIFLAIIFGAILSIKRDNQLWNNGYCECGGKYEYEQAIGTRYGTNYIYKCIKCDKRIQLTKIR